MARSRLRFLHKHGLGVHRLEIGDGTTPVAPPLWMQASSQPSGTAQEGDVYWDSTTHTLKFHNGTAWQEVGATQGGLIVPNYVFVEDAQNQVAAASYAVSHTILVIPNVAQTFKVAAVSASFGTASTSGTLQVEVATGTQAIAAGTNQLTGTMSLSGTANTTVNGTIIGSPTTLAAGNRLNLIFGGTVTNLANAIVTVALQRLS